MLAAKKGCPKIGLSSICKNAHIFMLCSQYYEPKFCGNLKKPSSVFSKSPPGFNTEQNIPSEWSQLFLKKTNTNGSNCNYVRSEIQSD